MTRQRAVPIIAILLVIGLTYALLNSTLITDVIGPLLYAAFLTTASMIDSLPQLLVWLLFMFIVVQLLTTGLLRFARAFQNKSGGLGRRTAADPVLSPVQKYQHWIERANKGVYFRWRVVERLMQIVVDTKHHGKPQTRLQIEQSIVNNTHQLPSDIHRYLVDGLQARNNIEPAKRMRGLLTDINQADHSELERTLTYLEQSLEIRNAFDDPTP